MFQDASPIPHSLTQLLWLVLASSLGWLGAELRSWLARRRREPAEIRRIDAETNSLRITTEIAPMGMSLELLREIRAVTIKAEERRQEWLLKEEQMRRQIIHWRNKAEELDGELIDSRQANALLTTRATHQASQVKSLKGILDSKHISYIEAENLPKDK